MIAERCFDEKKLFNFLVDADKAFTCPLSLSLNKLGVSLENYVYKLATCGTIAYEVDEKGIIMGLVIGYTDNLPEDNSSYITQVVTNVLYRGQGICGRLLEEYIEFCRQKGITSVWLTTSIMNTSAQKAYEKAGFVKQKTDRTEQIKYVYTIEHIKE